MSRIYEKIFSEEQSFAAATAGEKKTYYGTSSNELTDGRLPSGSFGRIFAVSVHPKFESAVTAAKAEDIAIFVSEAKLTITVGDRRVGGGPVKYFPAGGAHVHGNSAAGDVWFAFNGADARRLVAEIPVGALDVIEVEMTGPTSTLAAILKVDLCLHVLVEEKGKAE